MQCGQNRYEIARFSLCRATLANDGGGEMLFWLMIASNRFRKSSVQLYEIRDFGDCRDCPRAGEEREKRKDCAEMSENSVDPNHAEYAAS